MAFVLSFFNFQVKVCANDNFLLASDGNVTKIWRFVCTFMLIVALTVSLLYLIIDLFLYFLFTYVKLPYFRFGLSKVVSEVFFSWFFQIMFWDNNVWRSSWEYWKYFDRHLKRITTSFANYWRTKSKFVKELRKANVKEVMFNTCNDFVFLN